MIAIIGSAVGSGPARTGQALLSQGYPICPGTDRANSSDQPDRSGLRRMAMSDCHRSVRSAQ